MVEARHEELRGRSAPEDFWERPAVRTPSAPPTLLEFPVCAPRLLPARPTRLSEGDVGRKPTTKRSAHAVASRDEAGAGVSMEPRAVSCVLASSHVVHKVDRRAPHSPSIAFTLVASRDEAV